MKLAVITHPRTGSRTFADSVASIYDKLGRGSVNYAKSVDSNRISDEDILSGDYVLHGHWHTIEMLPSNIKKFVKENYLVYHIERPVHHRVLSSLIVMTKGNLDHQKNERVGMIDTDVVDEYVRRMVPAINTRFRWKPDRILHFDDLYNGRSKENFIANSSIVDNASELLNYYDRKVEGLVHEYL